MSTSTERMRRMRERQAAAGVGERPPGPRDAAELLAPAVEETIAALGLDAKDAAAVQLGRRYAAVIDAAESPGYAMRWLAPLLLKTLEELGATPAARKSGKAGKPQPAQRTWLQEMRAARAASDGSRSGR